MESELAELLTQGATLVTPNRRLAADIRRRYGQLRRGQGHPVWRTPDVVPFPAWLHRSLQHLLRDDPARQLLTPLQEQMLWQRAIGRQGDAFPFVDVPAAARLAREAQVIERDWRLPMPIDAHTMSEDCAAYVRWRSRIEQRCRAQGWVEAAYAAELLIERLEENKRGVETVLVAYGFDRLTPRQNQLFAALRSRGARVLVRDPPAGSGDALLVPCGSQIDEWRYVARRVAQILACNPQASVGVVVPDLVASRERLLRVLDEVLDPAQLLTGRRGGPPPYNLSAGPSLASFPLVHAALIILRMAVGPIGWQDLGSLLRSPFLGEAEQELSARAGLDARLRAIGMLEVDARSLLRTLQAAPAHASHACPKLAARLARWAQGLRGLGERRSVSQWSEAVVVILDELGWPGERSVDSEEYQTLRKWREVLAELAGLDLVLSPISFASYVSHLARLVADTPFQPESDERPVQILGVLESAGLVFDHLFVTGLHDELWPAPARANPFLPVRLQRSHGVPHASAEWEAGFALRMQSLWLSSARNVAFTCPTRAGDRTLRPSPLLRSFPISTPPPASALEYERLIYAARSSEELEESSAPALATGYAVPFGASVFANQSACPFRAFVLHRLGGRQLEEPVAGLDARQRGRLLHDALERLWGRWRTQSHLLALSDTEIETDVARAIEAALVGLRAVRPDVMTKTFMALEHSRLQRLILQLLALERRRAPFSVVEREQRHDLSFAGLRLNARLDRADELADGRLVVLDYKTGESGTGQWLGSRPDAPQLPFYTIIQTRPVAATAFVSLRPDKVSFKGLAAAGDVLPGVKPPGSERSGAEDWEALIASWRATLHALAAEFLAGNAHVAPKRYPDTCRHCALGSVCRVGELLEAVPGGSDE